MRLFWEESYLTASDSSLHTPPQLLQFLTKSLHKLKKYHCKNQKNQIQKEIKKADFFGRRGTPSLHSTSYLAHHRLYIF